MRERLRLLRRARDEDGFAVIAAMMVTTIAMILTVGMLATGLHLELGTFRDRNWNAALQVAEAGVDNAVYRYSVDDACGSPDCDAVKPLRGGDVVVHVYTPGETVGAQTVQLGQLIIESTGYVPSKAAVDERRTGSAKRKVRVLYGPYSSFKYALFSDSYLTADNGNCPTGDVFANERVEFSNGSCVYGDVVSGLSYVSLTKADVKVNPATGAGGDVYSGGYFNGGSAANSWGVSLWNSTVAGNAYVEQPSCPGSTGASSPYNLSSKLSSITAIGLAGGAVEGTVGNAQPNTCKVSPGRQELPQFTYVPSYYPGISDATAAQFQAYVDGNANLTGFWYVMTNDPNTTTTLVLNQKRIVNDFVLITDARIDFGNGATYDGPADSMVQIVSLNRSKNPANPAINIKNGFSINADPNAPSGSPQYAPVLLYSPGAISVKNTSKSDGSDINGAVYAGIITLNNNLNVTYDPRVERTLGFGPVRYQRITWLEVPA